MVETACHCGAVQLRIAQPLRTVTDCNCSLCRKLGALWAYYPADQVRVTGQTDVFVRADGVLGYHRCRNCGCTTHWLSRDDKAPRMGINARLAPPDILAAARLRHLDGANTEQYLD